MLLSTSSCLSRPSLGASFERENGKAVSQEQSTSWLSTPSWLVSYSFSAVLMRARVGGSCQPGSLLLTML